MGKLSRHRQPTAFTEHLDCTPFCTLARISLDPSHNFVKILSILQGKIQKLTTRCAYCYINKLFGRLPIIFCGPSSPAYSHREIPTASRDVAIWIENFTTNNHWRRQLRGTGAHDPLDFQLFNFSGHFRAVQTLTFDSMWLPI